MNELHLAGIGVTSQRNRDRLVNRLLEQGVSDYRVLETISKTPRHIFLEEAFAHLAYEDKSIPIGHGQTLSQPYIVARMTEILLSKGPLKRVLEVGTGSGYQTAILAQLVDKVFTVERIKPLQDKAKERLRAIQLRNVQYKHADGGFGWSFQGPYDGIISTAAPQQVPEELLAQLAEGGRLVIPVGDDKSQDLMLIEKTETGVIESVIEPAFFVPFKSGVIR